MISTRERFIEVFFAANGIFVIAVLLGIFAFLAYWGIQAFGEISLAEFFGGAVWNPEAYGEPTWGVMPLIMGTVYITLVGLAMAVPLGITGAIYLSEVASSRVRDIVKPILEMIA